MMFLEVIPREKWNIPDAFEGIWIPDLDYDYVHDWRLSLFLGLHILCSILVSVCTSFAVTGLSAVTISFLSCLSLPCLAAIQYFFLYNVNPGHENVFELVGFSLVLFASISRPMISLCCGKKPANQESETPLRQDKEK